MPSFISLLGVSGTIVVGGGGSPSVVSTSSTTYASRTNTTVTAPAGISNGHLLLGISVYGKASPHPSVTAPSGWNLLSPFPNTTTDASISFELGIYCHYKVASGESGDYTWTHAAASSDCVIYCISGSNNTPVAGTVGEGGNNTSTCPSVAGVTANSLVIYYSQNWQLWGTGSPPTGNTPTIVERRDSASGLIYTGDAVYAAGGATGARTQSNLNTASNNDRWQCGMIWIAPA